MPALRSVRPEASDSEPVSEELIVIGRVLAPHGVRGELRCEPLTDDPGRFSRLPRVFIDGKPHRLLSARTARGALLLRLEAVTTREAAVGLRGEYLAIPLSEAADLPDGAYYHFQLVGLRVRAADGVELGTLAEVLERPANDVYVVRGERGEVLVPALKEVVESIDLEGGWMIVRPVPGLLPEERVE